LLMRVKSWCMRTLEKRTIPGESCPWVAHSKCLPNRRRSTWETGAFLNVRINGGFLLLLLFNTGVFVHLVFHFTVFFTFCFTLQEAHPSSAKPPPLSLPQAMTSALQKTTRGNRSLIVENWNEYWCYCFILLSLLMLLF
jgi:hypothetical protein